MKRKQAFHAFDKVVSFPMCLCVRNNHHLKHSSWCTHNKTCWNLFCIDKMTNIKVFLVLFRSPRSTIKLKRLSRGMGLQDIQIWQLMFSIHTNSWCYIISHNNTNVLHHLATQYTNKWRMSTPLQKCAHAPCVPCKISSCIPTMYMVLITIFILVCETTLN